MSSGLLHLNKSKSLFKMNFPYLGEFLHMGPFKCYHLLEIKISCIDGLRNIFSIAVEGIKYINGQCSQ